MWIEEIFINAFGAFGDKLVKDLTPGLNILIGPNEAGKTTLLEFVRSIFFGFRKKSPKANIYESSSGKVRSGWITIQTALRGRLRVERTEKPGLREGLLNIVDELGNGVGPESLPMLRDGVERRMFQSFFAFDLESMRQLDQEALKGKIVATALGSFQTNPLDAMNRVEERVKALGRRSTRDDGSLEGIQFHIKEIDKKLKVLSQEPERYEAIKAELDWVNNRLKECEATIGTKESIMERVSECLHFEEHWKKLVSLDREAGRLGAGRRFPAEGILRLEQALEGLRETRQGVLEEQKILDHIQDRYESLKPDTILLENANAIHFLGREAMRLEGLNGEMERAQAALQRPNAIVEQEILDLGVGWSREKVASSDTSMALEQGIRSFANSWRHCSERILAMRARLTEAEERCNRQTGKLQSMQGELQRLEPKSRGHLPWESLRRLQEWKQVSAHVMELRGRLADKSQNLRKAIGNADELKQRLEEARSAGSSIVPSIHFWALVALLICSGMGLLVVSGRTVDHVSSALLPIALLLVSAVPVIIVWKVRGDRNRVSALIGEKRALKSKLAQASRDIAEMEMQRRSIVQKIEDMANETAEIAAQVLGDRTAGPAEILKAEQRSANAEEPFRRRRALEDAIRLNIADAEIEAKRRSEIEKSLSVAEQDMASASAQWAKFFSEKGFDEGLEPETALELVRRLREIKNTMQRIDQEEAGLTEMKKTWNHFSAQVADLSSKMGYPVPPDVSPVDQAERWMHSEKESREILAEKRALLEKKQEREVRLGVINKKVEEAQDQIAGLMEAAGVADEEEFRARGVLHEQYAAVDLERRVLIDNLVSGLRCPGETEMRSSMEGQDWSGNRKLLGQIQLELDDARRESQELAGRKGRLEKELETLEAEEEFEQLLARKEEWLARLNATTQEWTELKLASTLLSKTLNLYESEKQPRVLEKTSELLRSITEGAIRRILVPLNGDSVKVERSDGGRVDEHLLSRGTLEQVYLSLRLAHLESHCNGGFAIPILMDDILVNFDPERASRTAEVLAQFSEATGIQVLFFTCHPHVAGLFPPKIAVRELGFAKSHKGA